MNPLSIQNTVIALVIACTLGFGVGYYTKGKFVKADQANAVIESQHQTAVGIQESLKTSAVIESKVEKSKQQSGGIRKAVAARLKPKESKNETQIFSSVSNKPSVCTWSDAWSLDVGTVRLLNAARAGTTADTANLSDAEGQTPSGIGIAEFADNDLEVVGLYHELAERHNALVDYVESVIKKQAK